MSLADAFVTMSWVGLLMTGLTLGATGLLCATSALERWLDAEASQPELDAVAAMDDPLPAG